MYVADFSIIKSGLPVRRKFPARVSSGAAGPFREIIIRFRLYHGDIPNISKCKFPRPALRCRRSFRGVRPGLRRFVPQDTEPTRKYPLPCPVRYIVTADRGRGYSAVSHSIGPTCRLTRPDENSTVASIRAGILKCTVRICGSEGTTIRLFLPRRITRQL